MIFPKNPIPLFYQTGYLTISEVVTQKNQILKFRGGAHLRPDFFVAEVA